MIVAPSEELGGQVITAQVSGKLTSEDYDQFPPEVERLIRQHGKIRVLFDRGGFHGWEPAAVWKDLRFDWRHCGDSERPAMGGDKASERWMAAFCRQFTTAEVRYFDQSESRRGRAWLLEGLAADQRV